LCQDEKQNTITTTKVNKEKCDLAQKIDITMFISNIAELPDSMLSGFLTQPVSFLTDF